jgi:CHAT domain-containing protein/Flp pilus assembly protein TadD
LTHTPKYQKNSYLSENFSASIFQNFLSMKVLLSILISWLIIILPLAAQNFSKQVKKIEAQADKEKFEKVIKEGEKLAEQFRKKQFTKDTNYANLLGLVGYAYFSKKDLPKAAQYFEEEYQIRNTHFANDVEAQQSVLENLVATYRQMGKFSLAIPFAQKFVQSWQNSPKNVAYPNALLQLADLQKEQGAFSEATQTYQKAEKLYAQITGTESEEYLLWLNNYADLLTKKGEFGAAEKTYLKALDLQSVVAAANKENRTILLGNLANLYVSIGLYEEAEKLANEQLNLAQKAFENSPIKYANMLNNLGFLAKRLGNLEQAEKYYEQATQIRKKELGEKHPLYAQSLNNLGAIYEQKRDFKKTETHYAQALAIRKETLGENHPLYAQVLYNYAQNQRNLELYEEAEKNLERVKAIREEKLGKNHPLYAKTTQSLASLFWHKKDLTKAEAYFKATLNSLFEQVNQVFVGMSENERSQFFATQIRPTLEMYQFFALQNASNPEFVGKVFDLQVSTKALLFFTSSKFRQQLQQSGRQDLLQKYEEWLRLKEQIARLYTLSKDELTKRGVNLQDLATQSNILEKELNEVANFDNQFIKNIAWQTVAQQLRPKEAAVEVIRLREYQPKGSGNFGKKVYYACLILKADAKAPELVIIENGEELEQEAIYFYRNSIIFRKLDKESYDQFFRKLHQKLQGVEKVYFSADGVYNQISLATLWIPEQKKYLGESLDIVLLSSTRELIVAEKDLKNPSKRAFLFGYPDYDAIIANPTSEKAEINRQEKAQAFEVNGKFLASLPGSKREVENIKQILQNKFAVKDLMRAEASETNVKATQNPQILHIATHGFFLADEEDAENGVKVSPLFRSGLMMAGASQEQNPESDDGVLTAYEVMNLNLESTELVVLSACQTGLGQVRNGEGVYGLQRAFQVAGTKNLIMSLWSVDDAATQELMTYFYKELQNNLPKRQAFRNAQNKLKQKYPKPYYWGAFVLVGR